MALVEPEKSSGQAGASGSSGAGGTFATPIASAGTVVRGDVAGQASIVPTSGAVTAAGLNSATTNSPTSGGGANTNGANNLVGAGTAIGNMPTLAGRPSLPSDSVGGVNVSLPSSSPESGGGAGNASIAMAAFAGGSGGIASALIPASAGTSTVRIEGAGGYANGGANINTNPGAGRSSTVGAAGATNSPSGGTSSTGGKAGAANGGRATEGGSSAVAGTGTAASSGRTGVSTVTFQNGKAVGAMSGYGFVRLGKDDSLTSPTCSTSGGAFTGAAPCAGSLNWSTTNSLCVTGNLPVADTKWASWGLAIGFSATDSGGGSLGRMFSSISIDFTGAPTSGLRVQVHLLGDADDEGYCVDNPRSGTTVPFTTFSTTCFDAASPGTKLSAVDVPNIDRILVQISANDRSMIDIENFCVHGIRFY